MNWVFTVLISLGMTSPIWTVCSCSVLATSNLKRGQTCLCLQTFSLNTFNEELICLPLMLHPFTDRYLLGKQISLKSDMVWSRTRVQRMQFYFYLPQTSKCQWYLKPKHSCLSFLVFVWPILIFLKKKFMLIRLIYLAVSFGSVYHLPNLSLDDFSVFSFFPRQDCRAIHSVYSAIIIGFCFTVFQDSHW